MFFEPLYLLRNYLKKLKNLDMLAVNFLISKGNRYNN